MEITKLFIKTVESIINYGDLIESNFNLPFESSNSLKESEKFKIEIKKLKLAQNFAQKNLDKLAEIFESEEKINSLYIIDVHNTIFSLNSKTRYIYELKLALKDSKLGFNQILSKIELIVINEYIDDYFNKVEAIWKIIRLNNSKYPQYSIEYPLRLSDGNKILKSRFDVHIKEI
ncbi:MAG: hypothetical protein LBD41_01755 [Clostridiales Family XIII bacterium]|nr:hypothetical protein [Clostridiales Family XIII bacterium]